MLAKIWELHKTDESKTRGGKKHNHKELEEPLREALFTTYQKLTN